MWLGIASLGMAAVSMYQQGQAKADAAKYNEQLAQQNAAIAEQQGQAAVEMSKRNSARQLGTMVANYGASGVAGSSSASDVLSDSVRMATLDQLTTKYNYDLRKIGYLSEAALDSSNASNAMTGGMMGAGAAGLKGFSSYLNNKPPSSTTLGSGAGYDGGVGMWGSGSSIPSFGPSD